MSELVTTHSYEDLEIPGLDFHVKGTSVMDTVTQEMKAIFEVKGGRGRVTIEYEDDHETTIQTDTLIKNMYSAVMALTGRMAEEVLMRQLMTDIERELGDGAA